MKRSFLVSALTALLVAAAMPAGAQDSDPTPSPSPEKAEAETEVKVEKATDSGTTYALTGEARGLELAIGDQGLTLGAALSKGASTPEASGLGAGQCELLGEGNKSPEDLPCSDAATEVSSAPGKEGSEGETCASPPVPEPLDSVLELSLACGSSESAIANGLPTTVNAGRLGTLAAQLNLGGVNQQLEDAKDQVIDGLEEIIGNLPKEAQSLLDEILATLHEGEALRLNLGPTQSDIVPNGETIEVLSTAKGAEIGLLGIPDVDKDGNPIPETANALEDGLITIEIGDSLSRAVLNRSDASATAEADAAVVRVKVLDITKTPPVYEEVEVAPGESQTILPDTPLESTITAAGAETSEEEGEARAASDAVSVHALKGVEGGIQVALGRTTAGATVAAETVEPKPRQPTSPLPATGGTDVPVLILVLGAALIAGVLVARRVTRH
jgi:hypothetical protein